MAGRFRSFLSKLASFFGATVDESALSPEPSKDYGTYVGLDGEEHPSTRRDAGDQPAGSSIFNPMPTETFNVSSSMIVQVVWYGLGRMAVTFQNGSV